MMARDIRDAGLNGCNSIPSSARMANVLNNGPNGSATKVWWADWNNSVHGYEGGGSVADPALAGISGAGAHVDKTDSLELISAADTGVTVSTDDESTGVITINETSSDFKTGDIGVVCDPDHAAIVQFTTVSGTGNTSLKHIASESGTPGNCSAGLGYQTACTSTGNTYTFRSNALIAKLMAVDWYIGSQTVDGATVKSLYRLDLQNTAGNLATAPVEMVRNVTDMQITYHQTGTSDFVGADTVSSWPDVDAVRVTFTLQSTEQRAGTDAKPITRTFTATTSVRNRVPLT
jgi:type IV pilus assembly protein PilW